MLSRYEYLSDFAQVARGYQSSFYEDYRDLYIRALKPANLRSLNLVVAGVITKAFVSLYSPQKKKIIKHAI